MMIQLAAIICAFTGIAVLWVNPRRSANQVFAVMTAFILVFLSLVYLGIVFPQAHRAALPFPWRRANAAWATFGPFLICLLREALMNPEASRWRLIGRTSPWLGLAVAWSSLCLLDDFVFLDPTSGLRVRGVPYWIYTGIGCAVYAWIILRIHRLAKSVSGIKRFELQYLALTVGVTLLSSVAVSSLGNFYHLQWSRRGVFVMLVLGFSVTGWAVVAHRIFGPRRVARTFLFNALIALFLGAAGFGLWWLFDASVAPLIDLGLGLLTVGCLILWFHRRIGDRLGTSDRKELIRFRRKVIESSLPEASENRIRLKFEALLREHCQTGYAGILRYRGSSYVGEELALADDHPGVELLQGRGWVTPEAIERRRSTPASKALKTFLETRMLGLMLAVPVDSRTPSLVVALQIKASGWPYTYPEIERLQNIAELMDNILTRSRLTAQAALQAKTEHLAMMSRGLAHDLKNLLTPVSTFLIHTEGRFATESVEAEVHAAAQRSIRIMSDYVREAGFFAEKLAPRIETTALKTIFDGVRDATAARAKAREVELTFAVEGAPSLHADAVLIQRLVANLVTNALDACAPGKFVAVSGHATTERVHIQVVDAGRGIAPENLSRVFEPYFTTKDFGEDVRGFGLGLTICQKIVALHGGTITVSSTPGHGTTVRVELPAVAREAGDGVAVATRT